MAPRCNKRKMSRINEQEYARLIDKKQWHGWCEIESEPAYFNVMLRELGVEGLKMQEVFSLDESMLAQLPWVQLDPGVHVKQRLMISDSRPLHALIFLYQYRGGYLQQADTARSTHLWFANQIPDYSCASVALLNIVNNIPGLTLGPQLESFRRFTADMSAIDRGHAIDSFHFLRQTHNSFARKLDILNSNMALKSKHDKRVARVKNKDRWLARVARAAEKAAAVSTGHGCATTPVRRSTRAPKPRANVVDIDDPTGNEETDEAGYHFVAYVPVEGRVWRLDGMDSSPCDLGSYEHLADWMQLAAPAIQKQMAQYIDGELSFSLQAVVHDASSEASLALSKCARGPASSMDDQGGDLRVGPPIEDGTAEAFPQRVAELRSIVAEAREQRAMDEQKAMLRRFDYTAFFAEWVQALVDMDMLDTLEQQVKAGV